MAPDNRNGTKVPELTASDWGVLTDPLSLAYFWGGLEWFDWQIEVIQKFFKPGSRVARSTPNEAGKTSEIIANSVLAAMCLYPGCQIVYTSSSWKQIENQFMPAIRRKIGRFPEWKVIEDEIVAPSVNGLPPSKCIVFSTNDPGRAEGYHPQKANDKDGVEHYLPLFYILDEAKSIDDKIFEAMFRCDPDHVLMLSSPGEQNGYFYKVISGGSSIWDVKQITWQDCPHLMMGRKKQQRMELISEYGEKHPFIQSMIFGKFIRAGALYVFDNEGAVSALMSGILPVRRGIRRAAIDLSGGGDEIVLMFATGNHHYRTKIFHEKNAVRLADMLGKDMRKENVLSHNVVADDGGMGDPIIDILVEKGWRDIQRYRNDEKPTDEQTFFNKTAEDHFNVKKMLARGEITSSVSDEKLKDQMLSRKFVMPNNDSNRIRLEAKKDMRKRGDASPDRLDDFVMLFADLPPPERIVHIGEKTGGRTNILPGSGGTLPFNHGMLSEK